MFINGKHELLHNRGERMNSPSDTSVIPCDGVLLVELIEENGGVSSGYAVVINGTWHYINNRADQVFYIQDHDTGSYVDAVFCVYDVKAGDVVGFNFGGSEGAVAILL